MFDKLSELENERLRTLENIIWQKETIVRSYNQRIKVKTFKGGDLMWKLILSMERKSRTYGKWSLT